MDLVFHVVEALVLGGILVFVFRIDRRVHDTWRALSEVSAGLERILSEAADCLSGGPDDDDDEGSDSEVFCDPIHPPRHMLLPIPRTQVPGLGTTTVVVSPQRAMVVREFLFPSSEIGTQYCVLQSVVLRHGTSGAEQLALPIGLAAMTELASAAKLVWGPGPSYFRLARGDSVELTFRNLNENACSVLGMMSGPDDEAD